MNLDKNPFDLLLYIGFLAPHQKLLAVTSGKQSLQVRTQKISTKTKQHKLPYYCKALRNKSYRVWTSDAQNQTHKPNMENMHGRDSNHHCSHYATKYGVSFT